MIARNSSGEKAEAGSAGGPSAIQGLPAGSRVIQFNMEDLGEGGDLQEKIREKLKEQGIDLGDAKIQGIDNLPKGKPKKHSPRE